MISSDVHLSKLAESDVAESPVEDRADQDCNSHHKVGGVNWSTSDVNLSRNQSCKDEGNQKFDDQPGNHSQVVALRYSNDHDQFGNDVVISHSQAEHERGV